MRAAQAHAAPPTAAVCRPRFPPARTLSCDFRAKSSPNHFIAAFGFIAEHIFLGDAGLEASIPLIRTVLVSGAQQLHLISVGITRKGVGSLGVHLQLWCSAADTNLRVVDVDLSGNDISATSLQVSPLRSLHPILRTPHIRRLVLSSCRCVGRPVVHGAQRHFLSQAARLRRCCPVEGPVRLGREER